MNKIKEYIIKNKRNSIIIGITGVLVITLATLLTVFALNNNKKVENLNNKVSSSSSSSSISSETTSSEIESSTSEESSSSETSSSEVETTSSEVTSNAPTQQPPITTPKPPVVNNNTTQNKPSNPPPPVIQPPVVQPPKPAKPTKAEVDSFIAEARAYGESLGASWADYFSKDYNGWDSPASTYNEVTMDNIKNRVKYQIKKQIQLGAPEFKVWAEWNGDDVKIYVFY